MSIASVPGHRTRTLPKVRFAQHFAMTAPKVGKNPSLVHEKTNAGLSFQAHRAKDHVEVFGVLLPEIVREEAVAAPVFSAT